MAVSAAQAWFEGKGATGGDDSGTGAALSSVCLAPAPRPVPLEPEMVAHSCTPSTPQARD